jgi:two-component system LytT family response regulator
MKIRTIIVDDEKLARSRLRRMLAKTESIEVVGEAANGKDALDVIRESDPDVLFLDIRMPLLSGFEMLQELDKSPYIVFTTAYDEYALRAFEENAVDYLLKPISEEKLDRAISKVKRILEKGSVIHPDLEQLLQTIQKKEDIIRRFSVKVGDRIFIVPEDEIVFFHAEDKYTFLNTADESTIIPFTLKELESRLDSDMFIRVHRSFIVNIEQIGLMHRWFGGRIRLKMKNGKEITISQHYVGEFKKKIHL